VLLFYRDVVPNVFSMIPIRPTTPIENHCVTLRLSAVNTSCSVRFEGFRQLLAMSPNAIAQLYGWSTEDKKLTIFGFKIRTAAEQKWSAWIRKG